MAAVQASFLGYPGSTGVPNIDWLIGDHVVTPPDADHLCSEQVLRLPNTVFCFAPEVDYPLPDFDAVSAKRPLTFGSFNNIPKLTPRTIRLWAAVLKAAPQARLLLRAPSFKDAGAVARFRRLFFEQGIAAERLIFKGPVGLDAMMQTYSEIDIALDTFPYCGGTTSLQALWMGVPVLTLKGEQFVSRMGASFMTAAGLPDWIAKDDAGYVAQAVALGQDKTALLDLKRGLRARLMSRPGWDADRYTMDFGAGLRTIWQKTMGQSSARG
jgi:protein O-GlcNAc transferase